MSFHLLLIVTIVRALLIAAALTLLTMVDIGIPTESYWDDKQYFTYVALATGFISYASGGFIHWIARQREAEQAHEYHRNIQAAMAATLVGVTEISKATWKDVGVHAFRIRGFWPRKRLVNVGGIRLGGKPSMDRPVWTKGKGVVGQAWGAENLARCDWGNFYATHHPAGPDSWEKLDPDVRYHMSWLELVHSAEYRSIIAFPISDLHKKEVVGCVSIDAPLSQNEREGPELEGVIRELAEAILRAGDPPTYWFQQRV